MFQQTSALLTKYTKLQLLGFILMILGSLCAATAFYLHQGLLSCTAIMLYAAGLSLHFINPKGVTVKSSNKRSRKIGHPMAELAAKLASSSEGNAHQVSPGTAFFSKPQRTSLGDWGSTGPQKLEVQITVKGNGQTKDQSSSTPIGGNGPFSDGAGNFLDSGKSSNSSDLF